MVESAGLKFRGKLHSGMDDVDNMSKLLLRMVQDGLIGIKPNDIVDLMNGPYFREVQGEHTDAEANRLAKLIAGDCQNVAYNKIIRDQLNPVSLSPEKGKKPVRKVLLKSIPAKSAKANENENKVGPPIAAKLTEVTVKTPEIDVAEPVESVKSTTEPVVAAKKPDQKPIKKFPVRKVLLKSIPAKSAKANENENKVGPPIAAKLTEVTVKTPEIDVAEPVESVKSTTEPVVAAKSQTKNPSKNSPGHTD